MENTLKVIGNEAGREHMGSDLIALKLSEIIFAQALRTYLENEGAGLPVLAGFADANIARVLTAIHESRGARGHLKRSPTGRACHVRRSSRAFRSA